VVGRMLAAARGIVAEQGVRLSLDHLVFETIIREAGVSRTAAFRLFPSKERFMVSVIESMAEQVWQGRTPEEDQMRQLVRDVLREHAPRRDTVEERWDVVLDLLRIGPSFMFDAWSSSAASGVGAVLIAALTTMQPGPELDRLLDLSRSADEYYVASMTAFYRAVLDEVGFRLRPEYGDDFRPMVWLLASMFDGLALRANVRDYPSIGVDRPKFARHDARWSLQAIGVGSIVTSMIEPA
jgi:AcrR family transcriptional regulator